MVEINSFGGLNAPHRTKRCVSLSMACVCFSLLFNFYLLLSLHPALTPSRTSLVRSLRGKDGYGFGSGGAGGVRRHLAVVVPTHAGDLEETLKSLEAWPTECASNTLEHVDLVIYKAEAKDEASEDEALARFRGTAGTCFARTRMVYGKLTKEENVYPDGASFMFFKMFLDKEVKEQLAEYEVFAIIEHDVLVADPSSFSQLYSSAFDGGEEYWVKGSVLAGTNFHETAVKPDLWHVLGHINGNAIYNNTDPAFVEFVDYTKARWSQAVPADESESQVKFLYPYDVALWATIADFPYSWPLWQRFSDKFVTTRLIANVGFYDVDNTGIVDAVAKGTYFIHGSSTASGSQKFAHHAADTLAHAFVRAETREDQPLCKDACGKSPSWGGVEEEGMLHVCDPSCSLGHQGVRFDGYLCGAGDPVTFGEGCRTCYTDEGLAAEAELALRSDESHTGSERHGRHVIMCDTLRPPSSPECSSKCSMKPDTVCDHTCGTGRYGDYNCNWRDRGTGCRYCFSDVEQALKADHIARQSGGRVIMCNTHEPPRTPTVPTPEADSVETTSVDADADQGFDDMMGSHAEQSLDVMIGSHGDQSADVMLEPHANSVFDVNMMSRRLKEKSVSEKEDDEDFATINFHDDVTRGEMCVFMPGYFQFIEETEVTIKSVVHFMPGMRVVVAVHFTDFPVFQTAFGDLLGVRIVQSSNVAGSSLLADKHCGDGTKLIHYMHVGELLSREITFKDTHSPRGDLLVVHTNPDNNPDDPHTVPPNAPVLGFNSPVFGPDIVLPAEINEHLREMVVVGHGSKEERAAAEDNDEYAVLLLSQFPRHSVPQLLAAVAYARNPIGMWFFDPSQWVRHHLFKDASIWEIPLVKPRFGCMLDLSRAALGYDMGLALRNTLEHFKAGVTCETGFKDLDVKHLVPNPHIEFSEAAGKPLPSMKEYRVSVVYSLSEGDETLFDASLASVIAHFPTAFEVVAVVCAGTEYLFEGVVEKHEANAPFPILLVADDCSLIDKGNNPQRGRELVRTRRRLTADENSQGAYVLHMDAAAILIQEVTYNVVFHFGKPVMPYGRHPTGEWERKTSCRKSETGRVFGKPVEHRFAVFNTAVYPRYMYAKLREFIGRLHRSTFKEVTTWADKSWTIPASARGCSLGERDLLLPDAEFMGAFLWHEMRDDVHWVAIDPQDRRLGDWAVDVYSFAWSCHALHPPEAMSEEGQTMERYLAELESVDSPMSCWQFNSRWSSA